MVNGNKHLLQAISEYRAAIKMKEEGLINNISPQREHLRNIYRLIAGKEMLSPAQNGYNHVT